MFKYHRPLPKKNILCIIFIMVSICIFFVLKTHFNHGLAREVQIFQTKYHSFSSISQLIDDGSEENKFSSNIEKIVKVIRIFLKGPSTQIANSESIELFIKFKNLEKIYADRENAILNGKISTNTQNVPCKIKSGKNEFKCQVRLKGYYADHWLAKERMSLRIKVKGGFILGMKEFSIQKPASRQYPYDYHFQEIHSNLGGLSSNKQKYANIIFNGQTWGVMNIEEAIGQKFLERRGRKVSPIFKLSDQKNWSYIMNPKAPSPYFISDPSITLSISGSDKKFMQKKLNRYYYSHILSQLQNQNFDLFDEMKLFDSFVMALAWGGTHTLYPSNSSYYWNIYSLRLEPILSDQESWKQLDKSLVDEIFDTGLPITYHHLFKNYKFNHNQFNEKLNKLDFQFSNVLESINSHKKKYFPSDSSFLHNIPINNINYLRKNSAYILEKMNYLYSQSKNHSSEKISPKDILNKNYNLLESFVRVFHTDNGNLSIINLLPVEIKIKQIKFGQKIIELNQLLKGSAKGNLAKLNIDIPFYGIRDFGVEVISETESIQRIDTNTYTLLSKKEERNTNVNDSNCIGEKLKKFCTISKNIKLEKDHIFYDHVVIKEGVDIILENGADIIFDNGLSAIGSFLKPISIKGDHSGGILIRNRSSKDISVLKNISFEKLGQVAMKMREYTGAVNGYGGNFNFNGIKLKENHAEDQLNLVKTNINIKDMIIEKSQSDAFDCDFCKGIIDDLIIISSKGDGLDLSGSDLILKNYSADGVKDKGLSVGEGTKLHVINAELKNISTGVAVKDGSSTNIQMIKMVNVIFDAFMTYIKKPFHEGKTSLNVLHYDVSKIGNLCIRESGTNLALNYNSCTETDLKVDELYQGRMKK